jgi:hypothetical protein
METGVVVRDASNDASTQKGLAPICDAGSGRARLHAFLVRQQRAATTPHTTTHNHTRQAMTLFVNKNSKVDWPY